MNSNKKSPPSGEDMLSKEDSGCRPAFLTPSAQPGGLPQQTFSPLLEAGKYPNFSAQVHTPKPDIRSEILGSRFKVIVGSKTTGK